MSGIRRAGVAFTTFALLGLLWIIVLDAGWISPARFPAPGDVWAAAIRLTLRGYAGGTLLVQAATSVRLVLLGFAAAVATGVPLGLLMGLSRQAEALINPVFLLIRPIPPLAWIPLAILWFGLGDVAKVFVIWFAAVVPSVINTYTGVRGLDPVLMAAARVHGVGRRMMVTDVVVPGALPMIFTGLRLSLQSSWTTLIAAELVGAFYGLGRVLIIASQDIYPGMIAFGMACVAVLGAAMTWGLGRLERAAMPWRQ